ncbi:TonB-dependent receptor [Pontibacter virosus]|uniref:Outer membrane receptor protein involved in Fe transport n=1 Tax=Pontibacter virosus TaxID=1765052 RepID=A0A2U1AS95_9BACT|nr:TonB-dependent receptor [Pontibacter virosus]PVY39306.1 outer membrane receptor protein involved in Fe transport [Pontibacter virosus]
MHRFASLLTLLLLFSFFYAEPAIGQERHYELSGTISSQSGEPMAGAYVLINPGNKTISTDERGRFSVSLPPGEYTLESQYLGMERVEQQVNLFRDTSVRLQMKSKATNLRQVEIVAKSSMDVQSTQMGSTYMDVKLLTKMPALLGEVDVIRSVSSLPGVVSAGEGTAGFYVRGGSADQNLVLLDDVPVFNSAHLFGFFSVYNPDVLKSYTLHRSGISARYGSRISSILDVQLRDGNEERPQYQAGISPISAKFSVDGPVSPKLTILAAGRAAYPTYLLRMFNSDNIRNSSGHFYDLNLKANYKLNENNTVSFSSYHSNDGFKFPFDTTYQWSNTLGNIKWTHVYGNSLSSTVTVAKSTYTNQIEGIATGDEFNMSSGIDFTQIKADLGYFGLERHAIDFGGGASYYTIEPGKLEPYGTSSLNPRELQIDKGTEYHAYLNDEVTLNPRWTVSLGLRHTYFVKRGPTDVYVFAEGRPRSETSITDTTHYGEGSKVHTYQGLEPRASVRFLLNDTRSLKASYSRTRQYLQLVTNTAAITPVDVWKLANTHIQPQIADQVAVGYFYVKPDNAYEFSWEVYYKWLQNQVDYKDGAVLLLNPALEAELLIGKGMAYGSEWLLKKNTGRTTGWLSLTYSRSMRQIDGETPEETINSGNWYPSNYDKPLNLNVFLNRQLHPKWTVSGNFNYTTGRPITASDSWYRYHGHIFANYVGRNQARMPDYHRLDASLNYEFEKRKRVAYTASFSVYNLYGRKNAYSTFFRHYYGRPPGAYKLAIIGVPIPSINLNARF